MTPEHLQRFCSTTNDARYWLQKPWREGGLIYATNGHVMVEIPDDGRAGIVDRFAAHPHAAFMFKNDPTNWAKLSKLTPQLIGGMCWQCEGEGKHGRVKCIDCEGVGSFTHGRYNYSCIACDAAGRVGSDEASQVCLNCDGFGEPGNAGKAHATKVGDGTYQTRYLRLFAGLPGIEIAPCGMKAGAWLRFEGGRGLVMPYGGLEAA